MHLSFPYYNIKVYYVTLNNFQDYYINYLNFIIIYIDIYHI